jgi:hypothetical protein
MIGRRWRIVLVLKTGTSWRELPREVFGQPPEMAGDRQDVEPEFAETWGVPCNARDVDLALYSLGEQHGLHRPEAATKERFSD